ncbi:MAG: ABC transporter substrate-binding protein [Nostoc sp.]|uniref:ABC transporter substrate-binding protein n=1 Tax=Nostoc sp. TaxID=1180 RepID=UPI002FF8765A
MTNKNENLKLLISLGLAGVMVAPIWWLITKLSSPNPDNNPGNGISPSPSVSLTDKPSTFISLGTSILVKVETSSEKKDGVKAFADKDFPSAVEKFTASLKKNPNQAETLIYLNNAKIAKAKSEVLTVAVIAPTNFNIGVTQEFLRGIAQAQDEVNNQGGINGKKLQIAVASVEDQKYSAQLDDELVQDNSLVAVVGVSLNPRIYNDKGLVLVFPVELPGQTQSSVNSQRDPSKNNYLFHVNPPYDNLVKTHAKYIAEQVKNIAICGDFPRSTNNPIPSLNPKLVKQYTEALESYGSKILSTPCYLSGKNNFDYKAFVNKAIEENASGFLLIPSVDNIPFATKVGQEVGSRKLLFGSEIMYSPKTLQNGKDIEGMVLPVYWHRDANKEFANKAFELWNAPVNQRTAGAYDALQVIITGLKQDNTREGLQKVLSNPNFSTSGATGLIKFLPSGERKTEAEALLVKIEPSGTGYDFVLLKNK